MAAKMRGASEHLSASRDDLDAFAGVARGGVVGLVLWALIFLAVGCASAVRINVLPPGTINLVCHGMAGCSEQVYHDGVPTVLTVWCSTSHDVSACVAHEMSHIARRSSAHP